MGTRYEWMSADLVQAEIHPTGTELGEHVVDSPLALTLCVNECTVIEGTVDQLETLLTIALQQLADYRDWTVIGTWTPTGSPDPARAIAHCPTLSTATTLADTVWVTTVLARTAEQAQTLAVEAIIRQHLGDHRRQPAIPITVQEHHT